VRNDQSTAELIRTNSSIKHCRHSLPQPQLSFGPSVRQPSDAGAADLLHIGRCAGASLQPHMSTSNGSRISKPRRASKNNALCSHRDTDKTMKRATSQSDGQADRQRRRTYMVSKQVGWRGEWGTGLRNTQSLSHNRSLAQIAPRTLSQVASHLPKSGDLPHV